MSRHAHDDFAVEPLPGLPAVPPQGETILWQGRPEAGSVSRNVFHLRMIAIYFAVLAAWRIVTVIADGAPLADAAVTVAILAVLGAAAIVLFAVIARAIARTTVYTVTTKRVVMRIGVALPVTLNLPFSRIDGASLVRYADGSGSIALTLSPGERIAYAVLWPHVRPWQMRQPAPMLRCLADAPRVASILAEAFAAAQPARVVRAAETEQASSGRPSLSPAAG